MIPDTAFFDGKLLKGGPKIRHIVAVTGHEVAIGESFEKKRHKDGYVYQRRWIENVGPKPANMQSGRKKDGSDEK